MGGNALCPGRMSAALELSADLLFLICECQVSLYAFAERSSHPYWADLKAPLERSVSYMFAASTFFMPDDGKSTLFWMDQWIEGRSVTSSLSCPRVSGICARSLLPSLTTPG